MLSNRAAPALPALQRFLQTRHQAVKRTVRFYPHLRDLLRLVAEAELLLLPARFLLVFVFVLVYSAN